MNEKDKKELLFLENMGFDEEHVKEINELLAKEALDLLNAESETVIKNIIYLKGLGVTNYQDAFVRFYNMFLMEPTSFEEIFSKYDKEDLIVKLEKNIAIMEHL